MRGERSTEIGRLQRGEHGGHADVVHEMVDGAVDAAAFELSHTTSAISAPFKPGVRSSVGWFSSSIASVSG